MPRGGGHAVLPVGTYREKLSCSYLPMTSSDTACDRHAGPFPALPTYLPPHSIQAGAGGCIHFPSPFCPRQGLCLLPLWRKEEEVSYYYSPALGRDILEEIHFPDLGTTNLLLPGISGTFPSVGMTILCSLWTGPFPKTTSSLVFPVAFFLILASLLLFFFRERGAPTSHQTGVRLEEDRVDRHGRVLFLPTLPPPFCVKFVFPAYLLCLFVGWVGVCSLVVACLLPQIP